MSADAVVDSLKAALRATPDDLPLRLHLADLLASLGRRDEAVSEAAAVLQHEPTNAGALRLIRGVVADRHEVPSQMRQEPDRSEYEYGPENPLAQLEHQLADVVPPMYTDGSGGYEAQDAGIRLGDVGGMVEAKARIEAAVLAPMRNPELVRLYGKSLRGGLLLYGPPGCGKTFLARAIAGEMGAGFLAISLADVLDMYFGQSERNVHELFESARRAAPCVLFFDEVDAIGQRRSQVQGAGRGTVNQLLTEMDGVASANDGVFVLGATNHPWDVDVALRRPGRFDRMILISPPDAEARQAIIRYHLRERPVAGIDLSRLAKMTDGYSGADLAYVCKTAAEQALLDSARSGHVRMIGQPDLEAAVKDVRPSVGPWIDTARNVAQFGNEGGVYDELLAYLRRRKLL